MLATSCRCLKTKAFTSSGSHRRNGATLPGPAGAGSQWMTRSSVPSSPQGAQDQGEVLVDFSALHCRISLYLAQGGSAARRRCASRHRALPLRDPPGAGAHPESKVEMLKA